MNRSNIWKVLFFVSVIFVSYFAFHHGTSVLFDMKHVVHEAAGSRSERIYDLGGPEIFDRKTEETASYGDIISRIDLDIAQLSAEQLYERLVLLTGFSSNHFKEGLGFIETAQIAMPDKTIIVYDIGLKQEERSQIEEMCNVQLRRFPFEQYPPHFRDLHTYAFKPLYINIVMNEFGIVYYGDASVRFHKSVEELVPDAMIHHGFLGHIRSFDPQYHNSDYKLTVEEMFPALGVNRTAVANSSPHYPSFSGTLMLLVNSTFLQTNILKPWRNCALDKACIAPKGASLKNHRFDQSALTMLAYKNMYKEFTVENDPTEHHLSVATIKRGTKYRKYPKLCKTDGGLE